MTESTRLDAILDVFAPHQLTARMAMCLYEMVHGLEWQPYDSDGSYIVRPKGKIPAELLQAAHELAIAGLRAAGNPD